MREALGRGLAVLLISSDFEEVAGMSHRALVFDRGRVTAELTHDELSIARLTALAAGGDESKIQARLASSFPIAEWRNVRAGALQVFSVAESQRSSWLS